MSLSNNGLKTAKEYFDSYPENRWMLEARYKKPGKSKNYYIKLRCSECGVEKEVVFNNVCYDYMGDGKYRCSACTRYCMNTRESIDKRIRARSESEWWQTYKVEFSKKGCEASRSEESRNKRREYLKSDKFLEAAKKSSITRIKNNTYFVSEWENKINDKYNGVHVLSGSTLLGRITRYELDCYFPELNLAIEVDDKSHKEGVNKYKGYHRNKDEYFLVNFGIKILHITTNPNAPHRIDGTWEDLIERFLKGDLSFPLIDLTDSYYGDILYI